MDEETERLLRDYLVRKVDRFVSDFASGSAGWMHRVGHSCVYCHDFSGDGTLGNDAVGARQRSWFIDRGPPQVA
jgi:hypothetical protein